MHSEEASLMNQPSLNQGSRLVTNCLPSEKQDANNEFLRQSPYSLVVSSEKMPPRRQRQCRQQIEVDHDNTQSSSSYKICLGGTLSCRSTLFQLQCQSALSSCPALDVTARCAHPPHGPPGSCLPYYRTLSFFPSYQSPTAPDLRFSLPF